jgi:hypothetical protein
MKTQASSENLNKRAPDLPRLLRHAAGSKSLFDSKITSIMKGPRMCGLSLALLAAFTPA